MTTTPDDAFKILADAFYEHSAGVRQQLKNEGDELEALGWPLVRTTDLRVKAEFFERFLTGQYAALERAIDKFEAAKMEDTLKSVHFSQPSQLP